MNVMRLVSVSEIKIGNRLRPVDPDYVEVIAEVVRLTIKIVEDAHA
jgi:hypothetical protein